MYNLMYYTHLTIRPCEINFSTEYTFSTDFY